MKSVLLLLLAGLAFSCQKQNVSPAPDATLTSGRIVALETTIDDQFKNPRPRWIIDISPITLLGWNGIGYQKAKTFSLPDTTTYKVGQTILFHYQLVERAKETPWQTGYERLSWQAIPPDYFVNPEITLSDVQLKKGN